MGGDRVAGGREGRWREGGTYILCGNVKNATSCKVIRSDIPPVYWFNGVSQFLFMLS